MKSYFPDTNLFFECRKAADLPWHELEGLSRDQASDIRLIIPPSVIREIDRHKVKGNSRTARRARETSALLRVAYNAPDGRVELKKNDPKIFLELPPVARIEMSEFPQLDRDRSDGHIAAEYAILQRSVPDLLALTDDTLLAMSRRSLGFSPILIPERWRLPPEKDDRDDEIDKLRNELKIYQDASPDVSLRTLNMKGEEINEVQAPIELFEPSREEIEQAIGAVHGQYPQEDELELTRPRINDLAISFRPIGGTWLPPSAEEIEAYKDAHSRWRQLLSHQIQELPPLLNKQPCEIPFEIEINNSGFAHAIDARLTIDGFDGVMLLAENQEKDEEGGEKLFLPAAPTPPRGKYIHAWSSVERLYGPHLTSVLATAVAPLPTAFTPHSHSRDANEFYFVDGRPDSQVSELQLSCEALPHQTEPYYMKFRIIVPKGNIGSQPRLRVRFHASNLRRPLDKYVRVSVQYIKGDFVKQVRELGVIANAGNT